MVDPNHIDVALTTLDKVFSPRLPVIEFYNFGEICFFFFCFTAMRRNLYCVGSIRVLTYFRNQFAHRIKKKTSHQSRIVEIILHRILREYSNLELNYYQQLHDTNVQISRDTYRIMFQPLCNDYLLSSLPNFLY